MCFFLHGTPQHKKGGSALFLFHLILSARWLRYKKKKKPPPRGRGKHLNKHPARFPPREKGNTNTPFFKRNTPPVFSPPGGFFPTQKKAFSSQKNFWGAPFVEKNPFLGGFLDPPPKGKFFVKKKGGKNPRPQKCPFMFSPRRGGFMNFFLNREFLRMLGGLKKFPGLP